MEREGGGGGGAGEMTTSEFDTQKKRSLSFYIETLEPHIERVLYPYRYLGVPYSDALLVLGGLVTVSLSLFSVSQQTLSTTGSQGKGKLTINTTKLGQLFKQ